jgi:hypothetical protein
MTACNVQSRFRSRDALVQALTQAHRYNPRKPVAQGGPVDSPPNEQDVHTSSAPLVFVRHPPICTPGG